MGSETNKTLRTGYKDVGIATTKREEMGLWCAKEGTVAGRRLSRSTPPFAKLNARENLEH